MRARIPQDVDLEDKLVFGLSPTRFGYLVLAALAAFTVWSGSWSIPAVRAGAAAPILGLGAAFAWGRWQGRGLDEWAGDIAVYVQRSLRRRVQSQLARHRSPVRTTPRAGLSEVEQ